MGPVVILGHPARLAKASAMERLPPHLVAAAAAALATVDLILGHPAQLDKASAMDPPRRHPAAAAALATVDLILDRPVPLDKALATDPPRRHPAAGAQASATAHPLRLQADGLECRAALGLWVALA
jgi:hypothetical protein